MPTFGERLKELRISKGLSQKALSECLSVSKSSINMYEHGVREPSFDMLESIADFFNCDIDYLLGKSNIINQLQYKALVGPNSTDISHAFTVFPVGKQGMRPIYGSISAGLGEYVEGSNEILGWEPVEAKYDTDDYFYLRVVGDSMSPKIEDGDLLLIRKQESVDSGDIGAFIVDNEEGFVKRVMYGADYITFVSLNSAYEPICFVGEQVKRVRVVGKVIEIKRKL